MLNPTRIAVAALVALAALSPTAPLTAQNADEVDGFRAAVLNDLATLEQKYVGLAEAVPAEQYGWQPAAEVRTIGQVYAHIAASNYYFTGLFAEGRPADVGIDNAPDNLEEVTAKADVVTLLEHVFPYVREQIMATPDAELDREVTFFGQSSTVGEAILLLTTHMHEHLGQSIAYARSVGVTPPWSG